MLGIQAIRMISPCKGFFSGEDLGFWSRTFVTSTCVCYQTRWWVENMELGPTKKPHSLGRQNNIFIYDSSLFTLIMPLLYMANTWPFKAHRWYLFSLFITFPLSIYSLTTVYHFTVERVTVTVQPYARVKCRHTVNRRNARVTVDLKTVYTRDIFARIFSGSVLLINGRRTGDALYMIMIIIITVLRCNVAPHARHSGHVWHRWKNIDLPLYRHHHHHRRHRRRHLVATVWVLFTNFADTDNCYFIPITFFF